jgi:RNA polymerase sigma factor (sigma-70 family)
MNTATIEQECSSFIHDDTVDRLKLYNENLYLVSHIAFPFYNSGKGNYEDLLVVGEMALWSVTKDYDPIRYPNIQFSTYAVPRIRGAMLHEMRDHGDTIRKRDDNPSICFSYDQYEITLDKNFEELEYDDYVPMELFYKAVPKEHHRGLDWFLELVLDDLSIQSIADESERSTSIVKKYINTAKYYLRESKEVREWAEVSEEPKNELDIDILQNDINLFWGFLKKVESQYKKQFKPEELFSIYWAGHAKSDKEIAQMLCCAYGTVRMYINDSRKKLGVPIRFEGFKKIFGKSEYIPDNYKYNLTLREIDILRETVDKTHEEIGEQFGITARTVIFHLRNVYDKTGVRGKRGSYLAVFGE